MRTLTAEEKNTAAQLKARLWLAVGKIVEEEVQLIESPERVTATPQFVAALVQLVYNQALSLGEDLESFARHAKRKTVTPEDLFMATRRSPELTQLLQEFLMKLNGVEREYEEEDGTQ